MEQQFKITTNVAVFHTVGSLPDNERQLVGAAGKAMLGAYAPYSEFKVGAAVLLGNGQVIPGNNQENGAYPSGLCAERVALFAARAQFPHQRIVALAIQASSEEVDVNEPVAPCGACRQVMVEYEHNQEQPMTVLFLGASGPIYRIESAAELLPLLFHGDFLKKV